MKEKKIKSEKLLRLEKAIRYLLGKGIIEKDKDILKKTDYSKSTLSNMLNGTKNVSTNFINTFCDAFTDINKDWLLTGKDDMLFENIKQEQAKSDTVQLELSFSRIADSNATLADTNAKLSKQIIKLSNEILNFKKVYLAAEQDPVVDRTVAANQ
ncbi:MAG: hypothetical protein LBJ63_05265 [Prevotellaceae bacterium]|jgi:transcriptional regulator with XRE-family HTH domain|nr:hypothetical protein [Prevotellaceae bacterium]